MNETEKSLESEKEPLPESKTVPAIPEIHTVERVDDSSGLLKENGSEIETVSKKRKRRTKKELLESSEKGNENEEEKNSRRTSTDARRKGRTSKRNSNGFILPIEWWE